MPDDIPNPSLLRVADLSQRHPTVFDLRPDGSDRDRLAAQIGVMAIKKLTFQGQVNADGKHDWRLDAKLGATVVQPCVVSLEPVTTRIEQSVKRHFSASLSESLEEEIEMPEDDTQEPLTAEIDLERILTEALTLSLPDYPRSGDAALNQTVFAAPGVTPMTDAEAKPFAGLAGLKDKLGKAN